MKSRGNITPSLARSCQAIALLAESTDGLTASDLAERGALSRTTAFRVLKTLCAEGFATQHGSAYHPGPRLYKVAASLLRRHGYTDSAAPVLRQLSQDTGFTAHVATLEGNRALITDVCDSLSVLRIASRPGSLVWLHCSATGKAMLASMLPDDARRLLESAGYTRRTSRTITDWDAMSRELDLVRRRGFAIDDREYHDNVRCVASLIPAASGMPPAAIGITAPSGVLTRAKVDEVAQRVCAAAADLGLRAPGSVAQNG